MNVKLKWFFSAALMTALLPVFGTASAQTQPEQKAASSTQAESLAGPKTLTVDSIDAKKEVAYKCGTNGKEKLTVMYGIKDNQLVVAQVKYKNELTPNLFRVADVADQNIFWGDRIAWRADKASPDNVDKVNGNMLTIRGTTEVDGSTEVVDQIVTKGCILDKSATARLNKKQ